MKLAFTLFFSYNERGLHSDILEEDEQADVRERLDLHIVFLLDSRKREIEEMKSNIRHKLHEQEFSKRIDLLTKCLKNE